MGDSKGVNYLDDSKKWVTKRNEWQKEMSDKKKWVTKRNEWQKEMSDKTTPPSQDFE
jgi:hypothetical protein